MADHDTHPRHILVVDDDLLVAGLMADILTAEGHVVDLGELERVQPALLERLGIVSGTTEPAEYATFLAETHIPVLSKPFNVTDFLRFVQRML